MSNLKAYLPQLGAYALYVAAIVSAGVVAGLVSRWTGTTVVIPPPPIPVEQAEAELAPVSYEGAPYHGDHEHDDAEHVEANGRAFPQRDIRYWVDYSTVSAVRPPLSADSVSAAIRQAWAWWSESLEIEPVEVSDPASAHLVISFSKNVFGTADGPLGVLAACQLGDGRTTQKKLIFDAAERWTAGPPASNQISIPTVACHELGHWLGLGHDDATAPAVMRPQYTASLPREQPRDVARAVALGYAARVKVPTPAADVLSVPATLKTADVVDALRKAGYTVGGP